MHPDHGQHRRTAAELRLGWSRAAAEQGRGRRSTCYFWCRTGRATRLSISIPSGSQAVLAELVAHHRTATCGRMMVRAKCAPHFHAASCTAATPDSPILRLPAPAVPAGLDYCRITPDGKLTPCPYLPVEAGDLRRQSFGDDVVGLASVPGRSAPALAGRQAAGAASTGILCGGCRARAYALEGTTSRRIPPARTSRPTAPSRSVPPGPVTYGDRVAPTLHWTPDAEARLRRIPSFVRGVVVRRLEDHARAQGRTEITVELLREVRGAEDFSKRHRSSSMTTEPFLLRRAHGRASGRFPPSAPRARCGSRPKCPHVRRLVLGVPMFAVIVERGERTSCRASLGRAEDRFPLSLPTPPSRDRGYPMRSRTGERVVTDPAVTPRRYALIVLGLSALGVLLLALPALAQEAAKAPTYRAFPVIGSRLAVWAIAQLHLNFAAFILGVPMFAVIIEIMGWRTGEARYDWLAHEFVKLTFAAFSVTALFGAFLLFL